MEEINLKELFTILWSKKLQVILIVLLFVTLGIVYTKYLTKPEYKSTTTLVLGRTSNNIKTITQTDIALNQKLVATYTELIKSNAILRQVIHNLHSNKSEEELRRNINVRLVESTQLIEIAITDLDPQVAQKFTKEMAEVFIKKVKEIYNIENISIVDEANLPIYPYNNINRIKNVVLFAIAGLIVSIFFTFTTNMYNTTIKKQEYVEKELNLIVLASIPQCNEVLEKE
ncbi:MAG: hypothetical protein HFJ53_07270 [Clostridia bacterium]|jgi:capsular polysaccharide biosynthesis protein|nr:hypothetical protein [Clostridia bacterium]